VSRRKTGHVAALAAQRTRSTIRQMWPALYQIHQSRFSRLDRQAPSQQHCPRTRRFFAITSEPPREERLERYNMFESKAFVAVPTALRNGGFQFRKPEMIIHRKSTTATLANALARRKSGRGWSARCPAHDDGTTSLSISQGSDGQTLVHYPASYNQEEFIAAPCGCGVWALSLSTKCAESEP
jgi:hypothetical protein